MRPGLPHSRQPHSFAALTAAALQVVRSQERQDLLVQDRQRLPSAWRCLPMSRLSGRSDTCRRAGLSATRRDRGATEAKHQLQKWLAASRLSADTLQVNKCLSIKGAEDVLNKPHAFEITTVDTNFFFIADNDKVRKLASHCSGVGCRLQAVALPTGEGGLDKRCGQGHCAAFAEVRRRSCVPCSARLQRRQWSCARSMLETDEADYTH